MQVVSAIVIPAPVIFMMTIVGFELAVGDFRRVAAFPAVPAIKLLDTDAGLADALVLVAAGPIAAISNYFGYASRKLAAAIMVRPCCIVSISWLSARCSS